MSFGGFNPLGAIGAIGGIFTAITGAQQQAVGATYTGEAQSAMYNYQAGVAQQNAAIAAKEGRITEAAGVIPLEQAGLAGRATVAAEKTGAGAGDLSVGQGSSGRVIASTTELTQASEGVAQFNTQQQAYAQRVQAATEKAQAGAYQTAATTSVEAGQIGAQSAIIAGAGNVAAKFAQLGSSFGIPSFGGGGSTSGTTAAGGGLGGLLPTLGT
jgi:hypothetical protein